MTLIPPSATREVQGLSERQKVRIRDFLQGAVYCWCKNRKGTWFSMRDLMGGENFYWEGTPLIALYNKQRAAGRVEPAAVKQAGKESGWLLKQVLSEDVRRFETKKDEQIKKYRWKPEP